MVYLEEHQQQAHSYQGMEQNYQKDKVENYTWDREYSQEGDGGMNKPLAPHSPEFIRGVRCDP